MWVKYFKDCPCVLIYVIRGVQDIMSFFSIFIKLNDSVTSKAFKVNSFGVLCMIVVSHKAKAAVNDHGMYVLCVCRNMI